MPTLLSFIWFSIFGNTALHTELFGSGGIAAAVEQNVAVALFVLLEQMPGATVTSLLSMLVIATFFVTSADSGALVVDIMTANGALDTPGKQRVFWAVIVGIIAGVLLVSGGLLAFKTAIIAMALPALQDVRSELLKHGQKAKLERGKGFLALTTLDAHGHEEFYYSIRVRTFRPATFAFPEIEAKAPQKTISRAEVILRSGPASYDVSGFSRDQLILHVLHEYRKWVGWKTAGEAPRE